MPSTADLPATSVNSLLCSGRYGEAFALALIRCAEQPGSVDTATDLTNAAICAERADEVIPILESRRAALDPIAYARLQARLALACGATMAARAQADALASTPAATLDRLAIESAAAEQVGALDQAIAILREREGAIGNIPFAWLPQRWQLQCRLGRSNLVLDETARIVADIPASFIAERRTVGLHRAQAFLAALRFDESIAQSLALIKDFAAGAPLPATGLPVVRLETRRKQRRVAGDLEWLIIAHRLPVVIVAGTLLTLARDGDFHAHDPDFDLAVVPPATSEEVTGHLLASGLFRPQRRSVECGSFRTLNHIPTGTAVDVIEFRLEDGRFVSTWQHASGVVLRRSAVPRFGIAPMFHPGIQRRLPVPDDIDGVLSATYGDWRTPDAHFDTLVCSPAILEDTGYLRSIAAVRLADALLAGNTGMARHLAGHLESVGVAPDMMRHLVARLERPPVGAVP